MENHGKSWKIMENHGKSWDIMENHHFLMGKSTISISIFNSNLLQFTREQASKMWDKTV